MSANVILKSEEQINGIRNICQQTAQIFKYIDEMISVGVTTESIDNLVCHHLSELKIKSAALNYKNYPKSICTSVNHQICHGIPSNKALKNGDIVNIDICTTNDKYYADTSKMYILGNAKRAATRLVKLCQESLYEAIKIVKPGVHIGKIGEAIQNFAHSNKLSVVREFCGHGVGLKLHETPQILHYKSNTIEDVIMQPGMIFTIEPMLNAGKRNISMLADGWTAITKDKSLSAQWEHTILVTKTGYEILSYRDWEETIPRVS